MPSITVSVNGVRKLLRGLNIHKATGPDHIPTRLLHDFADELAPTLTHIFQKSLDSGAIPDDWREAAIVPIFKKGDGHQASNYRPVSLTSVSCKVLEHVIHSQIMDHYYRLGILTDKQHGFRSRRSCESQLIITIDSIAKSLAAGEQVDVILLDFSKAFDKVPHQRLLHKLDYYGVRGNHVALDQGLLVEENATRKPGRYHLQLSRGHLRRAPGDCPWDHYCSWPTLMICQNTPTQMHGYSQTIACFIGE